MSNLQIKINYLSWQKSCASGIGRKEVVLKLKQYKHFPELFQPLQPLDYNTYIHYLPCSYRTQHEQIKKLFGHDSNMR